MLHMNMKLVFPESKPGASSWAKRGREDAARTEIAAIQRFIGDVGFIVLVLPDEGDSSERRSL